MKNFFLFTAFFLTSGAQASVNLSEQLTYNLTTFQTTSSFQKLSDHSMDYRIGYELYYDIFLQDHKIGSSRYKKNIPGEGSQQEGQGNIAEIIGEATQHLNEFENTSEKEEAQQKIQTTLNEFNIFYTTSFPSS